MIPILAYPEYSLIIPLLLTIAAYGMEIYHFKKQEGVVKRKLGESNNIERSDKIRLIPNGSSKILVTRGDRPFFVSVNGKLEEAIRYTASSYLWAMNVTDEVELILEVGCTLELVGEFLVAEEIVEPLSLEARKKELTWRVLYWTGVFVILWAFILWSYVYLKGWF